MSTIMKSQEGLKFIGHKPKWGFGKEVLATEYLEEAVAPRRKWKIFNRSSKALPFKPQTKPKAPPKEFLCPLSGSLMADPVIVSSGHTFERNSVQACKNLGFTPTLNDGSTPDLSTLIPNLALKSAIVNWCKTTSIDPPNAPDSSSSERLVRTLMTQNADQNACEPQKGVSFESEKELIEAIKGNPQVNFTHSATKIGPRRNHSYTSSEESVGTSVSTPPLQLSTRPSCYSSPSSSEIETMDPISAEEEEILSKLKSPQVVEIEEAVISLRKLTKTREDTRVQLCTPRLLSALRPLIHSKYTTIQVNAVAALVNLSLDKENKNRIMRSGLVPPLIDVLRGGYPDAQEHACGALFSLALDDDNKTAIGVLGALPPLIHLLRSNSERTRHDSALALYHLSLVQSNRTKLIKLGSVPLLMGMAKSGHMMGRILVILGNLAAGVDGRSTLLDAGAVEYLVGFLEGNESVSASTHECCIALLYALSRGGLRFKALARAAGLVEVLRKFEKVGSERAREKVRGILEMMRASEEEEEEIDWEEILDSGFRSRTRGESRVNSSEF